MTPACRSYGLEARLAVAASTLSQCCLASDRAVVHVRAMLALDLRANEHSQERTRSRPAHRRAESVRAHHKADGLGDTLVVVHRKPCRWHIATCGTTTQAGKTDDERTTTHSPLLLRCRSDGEPASRWTMSGLARFRCCKQFRLVYPTGLYAAGKARHQRHPRSDGWIRSRSRRSHRRRS